MLRVYGVGTRFNGIVLAEFLTATSNKPSRNASFRVMRLMEPSKPLVLGIDL